MQLGGKAEWRESYIYSTVDGIKASPRESTWTDGESQPQRLGAAGQTYKRLCENIIGIAMQ
jgi:hypothetical protein